MARLSEASKEFIAANIRERLNSDRMAGKKMLPMPHGTDLGKLTREEWEEWSQRQSLQKEQDPNYVKAFTRPSKDSTEKVLRLLDELDFPILKRPPSYSTIIAEAGIAQRNLAAEQGLVIVLDAFIAEGLGRGQITYLEIFNALCRGFSDHFLAKSPSINSVRDMLPKTVADCRRDLLLSGIVPGDLRSAVRTWSNNPLLRIEEYRTGNRVIMRVLIPEEGLAIRERLRAILQLDKAYKPTRRHGINVCFADEELGEAAEGRGKVCGERPYNVVHWGEKSKELLRQQAAVTLYLDVSAFNHDYIAAAIAEKKAEERLRNDFGIDPTLSSSQRKIRITEGKRNRLQSIWSKRDERVYYRSIELGIRQNKSQPLTPKDQQNVEKLSRCRRHIARLQTLKRPNEGAAAEDRLNWLNGTSKKIILDWFDNIGRRLNLEPNPPIETAYLQVDKAMTAWRHEVRGLLEEYDAARQHRSELRHVDGRVKHLTGLKEIHSGFRRLVTRRYQPIHFWPTYVTSKDRVERRYTENGESASPSEMRLESYRSRWFKAKDPGTGAPCPLVGFDISSSQMQIIAVFMADEKLEKVTMSLDGHSFKQKMAKWVWDLHHSGELELRSGTGAIKSYHMEPLDERLQELVKELLMRVSYGSTSKRVERDQRLHPKTYGPGWETGSAERFVAAFDKRYPGPAKFREICTKIATTSFAKDRYRGIEFLDPFDGAPVRWNPVARDDDYPVGSGGDGLRISVPRGLPRRAAKQRKKQSSSGLPKKQGLFAGDFEIDRQELEKMAAPCLVHALDSYYSSLVMRRLVSCGVQCFVGIHDCWLVPQSQIEILKDALEWAADNWYAGLEPVYEALLLCLEPSESICADNEAHGDSEAYDKVHAAYQAWKRRMSSGWRPRFRAKRVPAEL